MTKLPEDSLENFFITRVNEYNIDYREDDWLKLNEMLDAAKILKADALRRKLVSGGAGALIVISIALLIWIGRNLINSGKDDPEPSKTEIVNSQQESVSGSAERSINEDNMNSGNPEDEIISGLSPEDGNIGKRSDSDSSHASNSIEEQDSSKKPEKILANTISTSQQTTGKNNQVDGQIKNDSFFSNRINLRPINTNMNSISSPLIKIGSYREESNRSIQFRKKYAWNFSLAADNSAVGMSDFTGPNLRAGIAGEYYFASRSSIMAGINYSVKEYTAFGDEYIVPYGYWNKGVVPDETFGKCNVLDIPINFTYYFPNKKGEAFFVRSGISSWMMLEEHYYYSYTSNDPDLIGYWGGKNENHHFFSILNISGGFEYPMSSKFSLLAEPYLNIPLAGVGYGHVNLFSAGLKFTMKINHYKLVIVE